MLRIRFARLSCDCNCSLWRQLDLSDMVIDEMAMFPKGKYDDLTDSVTQAI